MELWIPITIAAAFFQNLRSALQKRLKGAFSNTGASYARFCFAMPFALLYAAVLMHQTGLELPTIEMGFVLFCVFGGAAQIAGTVLLLKLFSVRNFAVSNTFSKTETLQTVLFGVVILGETISLLATAAIVLSLIGVMALALDKAKLSFSTLRTAWTSHAAFMGVGSGACFALSAVCYRGASLQLQVLDSALVQAAVTLAWVTSLQTLGMGVYLRLAEPGEISRLLRGWRSALWAGLAGMLASACWFTAMTLQTVAYVRALGQIELVFTFAASLLLFKERISGRELFGIALIIGGLVILLLTLADTPASA